jgi:glycosyltransferase involved in cell wall biosynthesis
MTSILLPVYNGSKYIEGSINTILNQAGSWELIIQDDCSADETGLICKKYLSDKVKYFRNTQNLNCWGSLNAAALHASGDLLRLFSHDDKMLENDIRKAEKYMRENPDIGLSFTDYDKIDENGNITGSSFGFTERNKDLPDKMTGNTAARLLYRWGCISGTHSNITLRREVYNKLNKFNAALAFTGDFDLLARAGVEFGIGYNRTKTCQIRFHALQSSIAGAKHVSKLSEMKLITDYLISHIEEPERKVFDRKFESVYGYYLIKQPIRELARGNLQLLKAFYDCFGFRKTFNSFFRAIIT